MDCKYYYNQSGQKVSDGLNNMSEAELSQLNIKRIGTEMELDGFLYDHRAEFLSGIGRYDLTYYLPIDADLSKVLPVIKEMHVKGKGLSGKPERYNVKELWERVNPDTFEFEDNRYQTKIRKELEQTEVYRNADPSTRIKLLEKKLEEVSGNDAENAGTVTGDLLQEMLSNTSFDLKSYLEISSNRKSVFNDSEKDQRFYESLLTVLPSIVNKLKVKFPNATFLVEQYVSTNRISDKLRGMLNVLASETGSTRLIESILGRVDITAVLPNGEVKTIELKTSKFTLPSSINGSDGTYPPDLLRFYSGQVLTYDIIRRQQGIRTTPFLLNIRRTESGALVEDKIIELPTDGIGRFGTIVAEGLPLDPPVKIETMDVINTLMGELFGNNASVKSTLETVKRDIEFFLNPNNGIVKLVKSTEMPDAYARGEKWYFIDKSDRKKEITVFAKNQEELREKLEKHLLDLDKKSANIWSYFAKNFKNCHSKEDLKKLLQDAGYTGKALSTAQNVFWKYTKPNWILVTDEVLISNGALLFQSGIGTEIVMLEEVKGLFDYHQFSNNKKGTTIQGNKFADTEVGAANRHILTAQNGHLMMMKAMAIVSHYPQFFKNGKILNITAMNARRGELMNTVDNTTLLENWKLLKASNPNLKMSITEHIFADDVNACVARAKDMLQLCENSNVTTSDDGTEQIKEVTEWQIFKSNPEGPRYTYEQIVGFRKNLIKRFGYRSDKMDYRIRKALDELDKAILIAAGYTFTTEKDNPMYGGKGLAFTGGYMSPNYRSPSSTLRLMGEVSNAFHYRMSELIHEYTTPFQIKLAKALKENEKYSSALGGEFVMSENWFVRDADGNIDKSFRFKMPSELDNDAERDLLEYVLETFARFRWPSLNGDFSQYKEDPTSAYYECPIYESGFVETAITSDSTLKGVWQLLKKRGKRFIDTGKQLVNGREEDIRLPDDDQILQQHATKDPFHDPDRAEQINANGVNVYTKNIDEIFLYTIISAMKHEASKELMPIIHAVLNLTHAVNSDNKAGMKEIEDTLKHYVKTVIFDKSGVKTSLLWAQRLLQVLREWYSMTTLGLNPKNLVRDSLSNDLRTAVTLLNGKDPKSLGISYEDYFDAYWEMGQNMDSVFTSAGYYNQINLLHRVANMSYREIQDQLKVNKFALGNLERNFLFITSTSSDYWHRMALFIAYMKKLGADKAYIMKDGILEYDMSKDVRWKILFKYRTGDTFDISDRKNITNENDRNEFDKRWVEYVQSCRAWQKSKPDFKVGEELPLALDPDQERSVLSLAHNMYGAYTKDEQALVHQTLLGGAFFQFKTYGISRLTDWYRQGGQISIFYNQVFLDEDGDEIWEVLCTPEEVEETGQSSKLVKAKDVTAFERASGRAQPYKVQMAAVDEGRLQSSYALIVAAYTQDPDLQYRLKDPITRYNVFRALMDILSSLMIMGAIRLLYPEEVRITMNEQDWWTRWSHAVMTGVAQDGPIWEIFSSVWGGGQIPVVGGISRWITSAMGVIHGNDFLPALANTFGATRELSAMLKEI